MGLFQTSTEIKLLVGQVGGVQKRRVAGVFINCSMCVLLLQDLVQSCSRGGGEDSGGHVLRETTSRGLCGLVCPSRDAGIELVRLGDEPRFLFV